MKIKPTVECKSFGIRCIEEVATYLDNMYPTLPSDCKTIKHKANVANIESTEERTCIATISTDSCDGEKEVVLPKGIDRTQYDKNRIVLYGHQMDKPPIGKNLWINEHLNGLVAKTRFASRNEYEGTDYFPDLVYNLVKQDILKGVSIGFVATKIRSPTTLEIKARPDWEQAEVVIEESLLLEYSFCSVGVNSDCLISSVKGFDLTRLGIELPKKRKQKPIVFNFDPMMIAEQAIRNIRNRGKIL